MAQLKSPRPSEIESARESLVVAVPELNSYRPNTGIGRVFHSLRAQWDDRIRLVDAPFDGYDLPVLRNYPFGVRVPEQASLVLLPKLAGAQALRNTQGRPSVVVVHDIGVVDFPGDRADVDWLTFQILLRSFRGLRHASQIITVSKFTLDRLLHHLPDLDGRVSIISNPVAPTFINDDRNPRKSRRRIAEVIGCSLGAPILIYVGTEGPRKNLTLLLGVLRRLKNRYPRAQLLKVGQPGLPRWRAKTLETAKSLGLGVGSDILILDNVDDATLAQAYQAADVFVSASLYEGFGLPVREAMAIGTPVVVTNCGSFPEIVGDSGWVVEPEDELFAQAVSDIIDNQSPNERVLKARARATAVTVSDTAHRYLEIVERVARAHSPNHASER